MPPSEGKGKSKKTKNRAPDATCNCILPREIIIDILSRLPVKTLLQFRCVCKPWRKLISKPNFIDTHFLHSSSLQSSTGSLPLLLYTLHLESSDHILSLVNMSPESSSVVELDNPYPFFLKNIMVAGSCNGIVCLFQAPLGDVIILWNPAMRQSRYAPRLSKSEAIIGTHSYVSIGLAYDSQKNDFLVLSLKSFGPETMIADEVEMYSTKSCSWERVPNEMGFRVFSVSCNLIIKGVPYWAARLADDEDVVLVYFDVSKRVLDKLPMPRVVRPDSLGHLVSLEDSLGTLLWDKTDKYNVEIWVMNDEDGWTKKCNVKMLCGFDRMIGCFWNGNIVAEDENGVLFLFDPVTSSVKAKLCIDNAKSWFSMIFNYSESLVLMEGMLPVKKQAARDKLARAGVNIKFSTT